MPEKPIGPKVLIPGFRQATGVRGGFGWFSAGWIGRLAPGLAVYLNRDRVAPIRFTVSPEFYPQERAVVEDTVAMQPDEAAERIQRVFTDGRATVDALAGHAIECLAWMLATNRLILRVAVPYAWSNYHPKLWLFDDGQDQVVVRGSGNATGKGVHSGVEHMDVDVSWDPSSSDRVRVGTTMLDAWENGTSLGIASVHSLPDAVEQKIINTAPDQPPQFSTYVATAVKEGRPPYALSPGMTGGTNAAKRAPRRLAIPETLNWTSPPYEHQEQAVAAWESEGRTGQAERGVLAMATGAGKTVAALICAARAQDRRGEERLLVVISAPSTPLLQQWQGEVEKFGVRPTVPTLARKGTTYALTQCFRRLLGGGTEVLVVTNDLLCSPEFQLAAKQAASKANAVTMLIGDEAHTLGAAGFVANQPDFFKLRLGLSATPERQYDPDGTEQLFSYFGEPVYEFGLGQAIGFCLVPYSYHVHAATLGGEELQEFVEISRQVGARFGSADVKDDVALTKLLIKRRRIVETAEAKIALVRRLLNARGPRKLSHTLVYASSKNPEQFEGLRTVLDDLGIVYAPVTENETSNMAKLASTFAAFEDGQIQVLLAKKVLDEGIDIPAIREALVVASSTIEREWVQRRGRILRKAPGKRHAVLHDFLALPPARYFRDNAASSVKSVVANELGRATTFAAHASNAPGDTGVMAHIANIRSSFWNPNRTTAPLLQEGGTFVLAPDTPQGGVK